MGKKKSNTQEFELVRNDFIDWSDETDIEKQFDVTLNKKHMVTLCHKLLQKLYPDVVRGMRNHDVRKIRIEIEIIP